MKLHDEIKKRCEQYPLHSQQNVADPMLCAKLFFPLGSGAWYVAEYNPITFEAFGYVSGMDVDEWGYFSVAELLEVKVAGVFSIEVSLHFSSRPASELGILR
ncbi:MULTISPECIES: DUF2958 domain-containing protein [unclassified Polaromonas]|uniref:DUF2958 domain-containing protein n=1 Tax=unclassified Polaromonas TaxID=2638319 RepID=UPI0013DE6837|nr:MULTISPECIES: DUF2958 domain-containing protein [unclassified Polaromonas]